MSEQNRTEAILRASAIKSFIQGEVLDVADACVVVADAAWPLNDDSAAIAGETGGAGLVVVPHRIDRVALLTQTCDLQTSSAEDYFCQVAPVVDRGETFSHQVGRGRRPGWVHVPWYSSAAVADLSRITTLERSVLVGARSLGRPTSPMDRLRFAETVSRHFTRVALPDPVSEVLQPVLKRMAEKHDRQSPEGGCARLVQTLRVEAIPDFDAASPRLRLLVVLDAENLPSLPPGSEIDQLRVDGLVQQGYTAAATQAMNASDPLARREAWTAVAELWLQDAAQLADASEGVDSLDFEVLNGEELSFARARNAPEVDLAYLTTRAA